jgi:lipoprotein-anchoring transpeptidase ErfK/SrfK
MDLVNLFLRSACLAAAFGVTAWSSPRADAADASKTRNKAELEAATRLQVFLDRAQFGPGKIDGRYGEFTVRALALYRQSRGEAVPAAEAGKPEKDKAPDVTGLDFTAVDPVFIEYTVSEADLQNVGELPSGVPEQAKLKVLPYKDAAEAIAEKFHCDVDFLAELNPGKTKQIKAGDQLTVPNVEPFELATVKDLKPGQEVVAQPAANEIEDPAESASEESANQKSAGKKEETKQPAAVSTSVKVDTKTNMLTVFDGEKLLAAYPVTIGSARTESPLGDWKVRSVAKMPNFRHDEKMLNEGERSDKFHLLPPGPNNPVGVIWIALNKKGIGLHGTSDPDAIGRSASHGCIRLANWDIVRLAGKVKAGVAVSIH